MRSTTQVSVEKAPNETTASLVRRFTKRVGQAGILKRARSLRYKNRPQSLLARKKIALKRMEYRKNMEKMRKLGTEPVKPERRR